MESKVIQSSFKSSPPEITDSKTNVKRTVTSPATKMNCGQLEQFDVTRAENWEAYFSRFKFYLTANEIDDANRQIAIFFTICGPTLFDLLSSLVAPKQVSTLKLGEINDTLTKHFSPRPSEIAAFYKFFQRNQLPNENFASYVAEVRRLAKDCNFGTSLDRMLRDRLVCGLRDEALQRVLLSEETLTLDKVITRATSSETATRGLSDIRQPNQLQYIAQKSKQPQNRSKLPTPTCNGCGGNHTRVQCQYAESICDGCGKKGHLQRVCRSTTSSETTPANKKSKSRSRRRKKSGVNMVLPLVDLKKKTTVTINNTSCEFEVDSGSNYTIISTRTFNSIWSDIKPFIHGCQLQLVDFQHNAIPIIGVVDTHIIYNGTKIDDLPLVIVNGQRTNVLGCNWFDPLGITLQGVHHVTNLTCSDVVKQFMHLFSGDLGHVRNHPIALQIDHDISPIHLPPRRIPFAIKGRVEAELDRLVKQGILEPVEYSEWATPIVPVTKKDGSIRICGDYKSTLNKALKSHCFQIPAISTLLSSLAGGKIFAKLDLAQAYQQLSVDERSSLLQTIITHKGAFRVKRLQFGISSAPGIFQNFMENLLRKIPGVLPFFDDIVVSGSNEQELAERLKSVLGRFDEFGLKLRQDKCIFSAESIIFLGFKIDALGIRPTEEKIEAIRNAAVPADQKQLQAFLGLLNFYHSFIPQKATIAEPLHRLLLKNSRFLWNKEQQKSLDQLKYIISSESVLVHYDLKLPLTVVCDASPYGIGAVLCHTMPDGTERPVSFYSKTLSKAERNYAQIDREAVAIVAAVKKFHNFIYGRHFTIVTDHRPLLGLFNPHKQIPTVMSAQMLRRRIFLSAYEYEIVYRPGSKMGNADCLSRLPLQSLDTQDVEETLMMEDVISPVYTAEDISAMTSKSPELSIVQSWALRGWPDKLDRTHKLHPYYMRRHEISNYRGCLLWGNRSIIPQAGQSTILKALHSGHPGIVRMKALARSYVWWPTIDSDVERTVKLCVPCQQTRPENPKESTRPWEVTKYPWSRLHIDFAGPFNGNIFFIVVDSHSKWLEVILVKTTSSKCAIKVLRTLFATHGLPDIIVSDNGTAFTSAEFKEFCDSNVIRHVCVAPYHPASNGQAERMVRITKDFLKKIDAKMNIEIAVSRLLFAQHITPSTTTGRSPAELLFNRQLKNFFDKIHPHYLTTTKTDEKKPSRSFNDGQDVWVRNYASGQKWIPGSIISKTGPVSYTVSIDAGKQVKRHLDQLRHRESTFDTDMKKTGEFITTLNKQYLPVSAENNDTADEEKVVEVPYDNSADEQQNDNQPTIDTVPDAPEEPTEIIRKSARTRNAPDYFASRR